MALAIGPGTVILAAVSPLTKPTQRRRPLFFWLKLGFVFFLLGHRLLAAPPPDYLMDIWDTENHLPSSTVTAIAQTPDGYLWVGTYNGLARFDGAHFVTFDSVNTPALTQTRVQGLYLDANGTLWINTFRGGLTAYRRGRFYREWPDQPEFDLHTKLVSSSTNHVTFVTQFGEVLERTHPLNTNSAWKVTAPPRGLRPKFQCVDHDGTLWFLKRDGHILLFTNNVFRPLAQDGGLAKTQIYTLVTDALGRVWAGASNVIARWNGRQFVNMTPTNDPAPVRALLLFPTRAGPMWVLDGQRLRKMQGRRWVAEATAWRGLLGAASGRAMGYHEDRKGGLWFNHYGNGLFHITPHGHYQRITTKNGLPGDRVGAWFQSRDGGIWVGVDHGGLVQLRIRHFHVIGPEQGVPARTALSVYAATNGAVWIGTAGGGLCRWQHHHLTPYAVGPVTSANFVFSIAPQPGGGLWLSASEGENLYEFKAGHIDRVPWDIHGLKSLLQDRQGRLWLGIKSGIGNWKGSERVLINTNQSGVLPAIRALAEGPDGTIWAGADDGTLFRCTPHHLQAFHAGGRLGGQPIYALHVDASGVVWAGTFRGGLVRFEHGRFARLTSKQGFPATIISQIEQDNRGRLWLGTHQGIYCLSKSDVNACLDGRSKQVDYVVYGRHDGLPSLDFSDGYQPASCRGPDGRLYFTTVRGVVWVNPDRLIRKSSPPPVRMQQFRVDDEPVALRRQPIVVPPGHKEYDFQFTALSFDAGDRARFRYRLEGFDSSWVEADTHRTAHYANLPPREYTFHVIACNSEGVWNNTGATVTFIVEPFFYQTKSFFIFMSALVIGLISYGVRRAVTLKYRRQLAQLEKQHAVERDRARIAKDIHDDVGAGLTQITLLTELARRDPEQTDANLARITKSARKLTRAMDEIVWAVDPQHDTVAGLMDYISAYAEDYLRVAGLRCRMDLPVDLPATRVDAEVRYNLFLALKEALNNIVKHAKATEVWLRLQLAPATLTLVVEDNGQGIGAGEAAEDDRLSHGAGLGNLEKRLAAVGGRCQIHSQAGQGTRVEMTVFLDRKASPVVAIGRNQRVN